MLVSATRPTGLRLEDSENQRIPSFGNFEGKERTAFCFFPGERLSPLPEAIYPTENVLQT